MCVVSVRRHVTDVITILSVFFFQAEDGIRYLVRSRGLGDVYKRQEVRGTSMQKSQRPPKDGTEGKTTAVRASAAPALVLSLIHI